MQFKPLTTFGVFLSCLIMMGAYSNATAQFALGADVSWLPRSEVRGVKYYYPDGTAGDCLAIIKSLGINSIRLRTWINPNMNDDFSGHCSQKETIQMAVRCNKLGLRVMIDFHYHNTWVSVGKPATPKEWTNMTYPEMQQALYDYAYGFCKEMKDSGVTPAWFQNGNETNAGLCTPTGSRTQHPDQMTGLLNKGYEAIHAIFPLPATKVLIHVAQPQKTEGAAMLDSFKKFGGKMDAIGWSSYANSGNVDALVSSVKSWHDKYKIEMHMVEIGSDQVATNKYMIETWNAGIEAMNNPCEGGTFYWEPEGYGPPGNWADAIFDQSGKPMAAWDAYKTPLKKACVVSLSQPQRDRIVTSKPTCYLNPSTHAISIRENGYFTYSLIDLNGKELLSGKASNAINVGAGLTTGVYLVKIRNQHTSKMVKVTMY